MSLGPYDHIIFNEGFLKTCLRICKDSGFMKKHVNDKNAAQELLSNMMFTIDNKTAIRHLILDYCHYVLLRITPENEYYKKAKEQLNKDNVLLDHLKKRNIKDQTNQICCILALGIIYEYLKEEFIVMIIERKRVPT